MINVELDQEMHMPCMCDCGQWFDLHDGHGSKHSNKIVCDACHEREEAEASRQEEIDELTEQISDADYTLKEAVKRLKQIQEPLTNCGLPSFELYLTRVDQRYATHNEFQVAISEGIKSFDRLLISDPEAFKTELLNWISNVHAGYQRCKPILIDDGYRAINGLDRSYYIGPKGHTMIIMNVFNIREVHDGDLVTKGGKVWIQ